MREQIREELKKIIMDNSKMPISPEEITDESNLIEDFSFDSITTMMTIVAIEDFYQIVIDDDGLVFSTIERFGNLLDVVEKELAKVSQS